MDGPDDWFPEGETPPPDRSQPVEDWLVAPELPQRPAFDLGLLGDRRVLVPAGIVVVFFVAILAAFGVFDNSTHVPASTVRVSTTLAQPTQPATTTTAAAKNVVPPIMTLKPGDIGPQVKVLQEELKTLGYQVGTPDGTYGTKTTQAVAAFQRAHGLTADGIVGSKTLRKLSP